MASRAGMDLAIRRFRCFRSRHKCSFDINGNSAGAGLVRAARFFIPENCDAPIAADLLLSTDVGTPISARFDFRRTGLQTWDIDIETDNGVLKLAEGGSRLFADDKPVAIESA